MELSTNLSGIAGVSYGIPYERVSKSPKKLVVN